MEARFDPAALAELTARGHRLDVVGPLGGPCAAQAIIRLDDVMLVAGSDPHRDGCALGL